MTAPSPITSASPAPFPRLQISDLLVLTLTTAFGLVWMESLGDSDPFQASQLDRLLMLWEGVFVGVLFFGFAVLAREVLSRGRPLSSLSPAHVWFLIAAPQLLIVRVHSIISYLTSTLLSDMTQWRVIESSVNAISHLIFAGVWLLAAVWVRPWSWRLVLAFKSAEQVTWVAFNAHRALRNIGWAQPVPSMHFFGVMGTVWACLTFTLLVAVALDARRRVRRDWLHYLGVAVILADSFEFYRAFGYLSVRWWEAVYRLLV